MDFAPVDEEPEAEQQRDNEDDDEEAPPTGNETTLLFDRHRGRRSWGAQLRRGWFLRDAVRVFCASAIAFVTVIYVLPLVLFAFRLSVAQLEEVHAVGFVVVLGRDTFEAFPLKVESALIITEVGPFVSAIIGTVDHAVTNTRIVDAKTLFVSV